MSTARSSVCERVVVVVGASVDAFVDAFVYVFLC